MAPYAQVVESIDPFGCSWRREADLEVPRAEVGMAGTHFTGFTGTKVIEPYWSLHRAVIAPSAGKEVSMAGTHFTGFTGTKVIEPYWSLHRAVIAP
jgi:hypothetical protein